MSGVCTYWYRTRHRELLARLEYQALSLQERGALVTIENMAAYTNNCGTVQIDGEKQTRRSLAGWLARNVRGAGEDTARAIVTELLRKGLLVERRGFIVAERWLLDQIEAPTAAAERQRRHREKLAAAAAGEDPARRSGAQDDWGKSSGHADAGSPPPPSPPPSVVGSVSNSGSDTERDMSRKSSVTCHDTEEPKNEERRTRSAYASDSSGGGEGGGGSGDDLYFPGNDAVTLAERLTGSGGARNHSCWLKARSQLGDQRFRECLAELRQESQRTRLRSPAAYLIGILKRHGAHFAGAGGVP